MINITKEKNLFILGDLPFDRFRLMLFELDDLQEMRTKLLKFMILYFFLFLVKKGNMDELFVGMTQLDRTLYLIRGSIKLPLFKDPSKIRKPQ